MFTHFADATSRSLAVTAITGYQKFISPHKGFACAHRVLYGCESCSQYFKRVIAEEGIVTAIANAKERFQECRAANEILKQRRQKCQRRRQYQANRIETNHSLRRPVLAINDNGDNGDQEDIDSNPDSSQDASSNPENKKSIGGSQWQKKTRSPNNQTDQNSLNNNCNNCSDCADCANCADVVVDVLHGSNCGGDRQCDNPLEGAGCPELSCPDLSCGDADCLSGMDCSGLDCSGLDCGGLDCGGCG